MYYLNYYLRDDDVFFKFVSYKDSYSSTYTLLSTYVFDSHLNKFIPLDESIQDTRLSIEKRKRYSNSKIKRVIDFFKNL